MVVERIDRPHPDPRGALRERVLEAAGEDFREEDVVLERTREGFTAGISPAAQRRELTEDALEQAGEGFTEEDVEIEATEEGLRAMITPEAQRRVLRERAAAESELLQPSDITVQEAEDGFRAGLTEAAEDRLAAEEIRRLEAEGFGTPIPSEARSPVRRLEFVQTPADRANLSEALRRSGSGGSLRDIRDDPAAVILALDPDVVERAEGGLPFTAEEIREAQEAIRQAEELKAEDPSAFIDEFGTAESLESVARIETQIAESFERGRGISRQEREFREEVGEELGVRADRIEVERTDGRFQVAGVFGEAEEQLQQQIAEEEFGGAIQPSELNIAIEDGRIRAEATRAGRERVFEARFEERLGFDVEAGEDFRLTREDGRFVAEPTERLLDRARERQEAEAIERLEEQLGFEVARTGATDGVVVDVSPEPGLQISPLGGGRPITIGDDGVEPIELEAGVDFDITEEDGVLRARFTEEVESVDVANGDGVAAVERIESIIRSQFARRGGSFASAMAPPDAQAEGIGPGDVDLDLSPDDIDIVDGGVVLTEAGEEKIDELQRLEAETVLGQELTAQFGVEFDPGRDFRAVETESGEFGVKLTSSGEEKITGVPAGPTLLPDTRSDAERLMGEIELDFTIPDTQLDVGEAIDTAQERVSDFVGVAGPLSTAVTIENLERAADPESPGGREITLEELVEAGREQEGLGITIQQGATEGAVGLASLPLSTADLVLSAVELGVFNVEETLEGRGPEAFDRTADAVTEAAIGEVQAVERQLREDPARTGAALTTGLVGSALVFGGARRISPRTGLATRVAIQPGEEIAGIGGFHATRGVGRALRRPEVGKRAAERLFPNKEPLIFSEEAAIRAGSRVNTRVRQSIADTRERIARVEGVDVEPRAGAGLVPPGLRLRGETELELDEELQTTLREAERGAMIRRAEAAAQQRIRTGDTGRKRRPPDDEPFVAERTKGLDFTPTRPGGPRKSTPAQARARRARLTSGAYQRRRMAQRPTVEAETEGPAREVEAEQEAIGQAGRRVETTLITEGLLEQAQQQELVEAAELDVETQVGQEIEPLGRVETGLNVESIERSETETIQDLEFETEQELRQVLELESEFETEFESETEVELETEAELELETETETEVETEVETEFEQEIEVEVDPRGDLETRGRREDEDDPLGLFSKQFEASVATSEEILNSDIDAIDADVAADSIDTGRDLAADLADVDADLEEVFDNDGI